VQTTLGLDILKISYLNQSNISQYVENIPIAFQFVVIHCFDRCLKWKTHHKKVSMNIQTRVYILLIYLDIFTNLSSTFSTWCDTLQTMLFSDLQLHLINFINSVGATSISVWTGTSDVPSCPFQWVRMNFIEGLPHNCLLINPKTMLKSCSFCWQEIFWKYFTFSHHVHKFIVSTN